MGRHDGGEQLVEKVVWHFQQSSRKGDDSQAGESGCELVHF